MKSNIAIGSPLQKVDLIANSYFSIEDILTEKSWETVRSVGFFE